MLLVHDCCGPQCRCYRIAENNLASIRTYGWALARIRVRTTTEHDSCSANDESGWTGRRDVLRLGGCGPGAAMRQDRRRATINERVMARCTRGLDRGSIVGEEAGERFGGFGTRKAGGGYCLVDWRGG